MYGNMTELSIRQIIYQQDFNFHSTLLYLRRSEYLLWCVLKRLCGKADASVGSKIHSFHCKYHKKFWVPKQHSWSTFYDMCHSLTLFVPEDYIIESFLISLSIFSVNMKIYYTAVKFTCYRNTRCWKHFIVLYVKLLYIYVYTQEYRNRKNFGLNTLISLPAYFDQYW
jgi:hypothetical protein